MSAQYSGRRWQEPAICRILDANLDRAREGLRIIEEWCRFGLNSGSLANECKQMRQELASWHTQEIRASRDTPQDPGTELTHPKEEQRSSIEQLLQANLCRVEEALRVLEEYGKLYQSEMGAVFKQMRYRVYTLESNLLAYRRHQLLERSHLYLVTSTSEQLFTTVEAALQGGLTLVQYREKTADDTVRLSYAQKLCQMCHHYGALFIMNDRVDLALAVDADGVHLGQQDIPIALARQLLGSQRLIGRSTTNPEEMRRAIDEGADYIGVGPIYETPTKEGKAAAGLEYVQYAAKQATIPWFAIGGIDPSNINEVLGAGAGRVAIVRAIMQAEQPTLITQYFCLNSHDSTLSVASKPVSLNLMSNTSDRITLQVNGETRTCPPQTPLPQLLEQLGLNPRLVAVEYNGEILHRQYWSQTQIQEGDKLEIVTIVGGG